MKYVVYVIQNNQGKKYTGYSNNIEKRLMQHNSGITKSTRYGENWELIYSKEFDLKRDAILFEKYLKTGKGRDYLKLIIGE